ncbi:MAG TPA: hypothetical protein VLB44_12405, partial [Kofleriaceae bacterium]|nr:hypothetical protein [Kofleriaceae bacterium]
MTWLARASVRHVLVVLYVLALAVVLALAYGEPFGTGNQNTYLLDPLVRAYPELYRHDWFVTANHHYHVVFAVTTAPLFALDPDGTGAFAICQIVVAVATFAAICGLVTAITTRARVALFSGILGLLVLGGDRALGGSYVFSAYLQPSSLACLAWLLAMNAWIRERLLVAGIALGVGAAFHLNYAVLGIGIFGLCELATGRGRTDRLRRMALLLAPSLIVMVAFLPTMIASSTTN